ncbi:MAG: DUF305 domain-containing protein [Verrucomicrobia bacterium]|nr:DUF305 domain-containing protein [Leptolyngbya sp. ES-bin-22]
MNKKTMIYSVVGLLTSGGLAGLLIANRTQAQSSNTLPRPGTQAPAPQNSMMTRPDQHFIEMMIPHHQDAVEMANLALTRAKHAEVKKLAAAIKRDQTREIQQMWGWYKTWYGKDVPQVATGAGMMGNGQGMMGNGQGMMGNGQGMGQGMMTRNGMMHTDLVALKNASDFDKEFIRQMIPHHQMAVHMAQMVLNQKTRPQIHTLTQSIIKSQTTEINQMQQWQQAWFK